MIPASAISLLCYLCSKGDELDRKKKKKYILNFISIHKKVFCVMKTRIL